VISIKSKKKARKGSSVPCWDWLDEALDGEPLPRVNLPDPLERSKMNLLNYKRK